MFNFPIFGGLLGARTATATFKGDAARPVVGLMARIAVENDQLSPSQAKRVASVDSLTKELKKGRCEVLGTAVRDSSGKVTIVPDEEGEAERSFQDYEDKEVPDTGFKGSPVEEEAPLEFTASKSAFDPVVAHEAKGEPQRVEPREEPKKISPAMSHFLEVFDNKEVVDLDRPKKTWPNEVKSRVKEKTWAEFTEAHGNGTGYYDPITNKEFGLPIGTLLKGTDAQGRNMVIIVGDPDTMYGNVVVFQRYTPDPTPQGPLVANVPDRVGKLFQVGGSALMAAELQILFGSINPVEENLYKRLFAEDV